VQTESKPRRRLSPEARRAEIIDVATRLISERGYRGVSLESIADECGMTKAGVQHHFPSKDELLVAVLENRDAEELAYGLESIVQAYTPEQFLEGARANFQRIYERPEVIRLFTVLGAEALDESHPAHAYFEARMQHGRSHWKQYAGQWFSDPDGAAVTYMSFLDGLQLSWLRDSTIDFRGLAYQFLEGLLRGRGAARR
jgi:AcrR family transcriptional regulator